MLFIKCTYTHTHVRAHTRTHIGDVVYYDNCELTNDKVSASFILFVRGSHNGSIRNVSYMHALYYMYPNELKEDEEAKSDFVLDY